MVTSLRLEGTFVLLLQQGFVPADMCEEQESEVMRDCGERLHQLFPGELVWQQPEDNGTEGEGPQQLREGGLEEEEQHIFPFSHCLPQFCDDNCFGDSFWSPRHPLQDEDTGLMLEPEATLSLTGTGNWTCCISCVLPLLLVVAEAVAMLDAGVTFVANLLVDELLLLGC